MKKRQVVVVRRSHRSAKSTSSTSSPAIRTVWYGECQRNHAASLGGYAVDGCREFMASSVDGTSNNALNCAACGCHRNFHRKEVEAAATEVVCEYRPPGHSRQ